ncbi:hypothetical protein ACEWY4_025381 [Coilia grayii]|uniref:RPGR interacting protein 1 n=1 Tax=Coilia grayii TaxID=363190 RepID=A0ABD1IXF7_9TELE
MSVEDLSETLLQIKAFRLQQESQEGLHVLCSNGKEKSPEMVNLQASYAETVFELQKTRDLLLLQHRISADLQAELKTVKLRAATEKQQSQKRVTEKERMLKSRMRQIITLQAQLRELVYSPKIYKRTTPAEYTWSEKDQDNISPLEDDHIVSQLQRGESLLEIHLQGAAFTALGLRVMGQLQASEYGASTEFTTFCTYALLDFETHSTPLVSGVQPSYGFTSRYPLAPSDLGRLVRQGGIVTAELHQRLGGVLFVTCGRAEISLLSTIEERGEKLHGTANITGKDEEILGILEYWVRLHPPRGATKSVLERVADRQLETRVTQKPQRWKAEIYQGDKVRVEILSLSFHPNSRVAMDQSVQRVYVEYRLLGVPMETTETPISLRKPTDGEEIHYNFIRVIYVDTVESAPLRHYLYTMLEGMDPNKGRLKFTVVSEPINEQEECVDVGYAYLDLKELLLTGNDITEKPIDILSVNEDEEVMGQLKVSMEAATALTGIYREYFKREEKQRGKKVKAYT